MNTEIEFCRRQVRLTKELADDYLVASLDFQALDTAKFAGGNLMLLPCMGLSTQTRDLGRTDVIVDYRGEQFIIELKIYHGKEYNNRAQLYKDIESYPVLFRQNI